MTEPQPLQETDLQLIYRYSHCTLRLSPRQFYANWAISYEAIAAICGRSPATVRRWFSRGSSYRAPSPADLYHLAVMDFLLRHQQELPATLLQAFCPPLATETAAKEQDA